MALNLRFSKNKVCKTIDPKIFSILISRKWSGSSLSTTSCVLLFDDHISLHEQNFKKKKKYLENEKRFLGEIKSFFYHS